MKPLPFSDAYAGSQARLAAVMSDQGPPFLRLQQMAGGGPDGFRAIVPCWRPSRSSFGDGPAVLRFP